MNDYRGKLCPECRYPMLALESFEGVSSRDAPRPGYNDGSDSWTHLGWGAVVPHVLGMIWGEMGLAMRKWKVKRLQKAHLPQYPNTLICPQCYSIVRQS